MALTPEAELARIANIAYQARCGGLAAIVAEETALRAQLAQLAASARADDVLGLPALYDARRIGADMRWSAWLDNKRAELNRKLALVLARKADEVRALGRAFGRAEAANELACKALKLQSDKRSKRAEERLEAQILMAVYQGPAG